ncbi:hypothetical protein GCM10011408_34440 [Dyella caseinilytica]|nr:hypothetical protein GCM10011408_34440 [Dyella caseinilytica]
MIEVFGELRQIVTDLLAFGIEILQIFNFKLGGDGHDSLPGWGKEKISAGEARPIQWGRTHRESPGQDHI